MRTSRDSTSNKEMLHRAYITEVVVRTRLCSTAWEDKSAGTIMCSLCALVIAPESTTIIRGILYREGEASVSLATLKLSNFMKVYL